MFPQKLIERNRFNLKRSRPSVLPIKAGGFGWCLGIVVVVAAAAKPYGAALAQEAPSLSDAAKAMIGAWEFSNADRDRICRFVFRAEPGPGGYQVDVDKNCPTLFPATKDIVGWAVDNFGTLRLLDANGNAALELSEAETGLYDGFDPGQGRYVLQIAAAAPVHSAAEVVGEWAIARGTGRPICTLTLTNTPVGADALLLKLKPGCDPTVTRFAPNSWRMNQGELILLSTRGQMWRFEENDANTWQRVPEGPDPVLLVRQ